MAAAKQTAYSQGYHDSVTKVHAARTAANSAAFLLPYLQNDMTVLDVGCGPGSITCDFAEILKRGTVIGVDLSPEVLKQAVALRQTRNLTNVSFEPGNIFDGLSFDDDTFDVVYCNQFLIHMPDPITALKEMRRVCKQGGLVACREGDLQSAIFYPTAPGLEQFVSAYCKMLKASGASDAGRRLHVWARQAGFHPNRIAKTASATSYATQEERNFYAATTSARLEKSDIRSKFIEGGSSEADIREMLDILELWRTDQDGWQCMIQGEVVCRK